MEPLQNPQQPIGQQIISQWRDTYILLSDNYLQSLINYCKEWFRCDETEAEELALQTMLDVPERLDTLTPEDLEQDDPLHRLILKTARDLRQRQSDKLFYDLIQTKEGLAQIAKLSYRHQLTFFYRYRKFRFTWKDISHATGESDTAWRRRGTDARIRLRRIHENDGQS